MKECFDSEDRKLIKDSSLISKDAIIRAVRGQYMVMILECRDVVPERVIRRSGGRRVVEVGGGGAGGQPGLPRQQRLHRRQDLVTQILTLHPQLQNRRIILVRTINTNSDKLVLIQRSV